MGSTAPRPAERVGPVQPHALHRRIGATAQDVSAFLGDFTDITATWPLCQTVLGDAVILLGEFLNNVVEHGDPAPETEIDIAVTLGVAHLRVATVDRGAPLPGDCLAGAVLPDAAAEIDDLPEGGFGWFIIHQIASDIAYERTDDRNCLVFSIPA